MRHQHPEDAQLGALATAAPDGRPSLRARGRGHGHGHGSLLLPRPGGGRSDDPPGERREGASRRADGLVDMVSNFSVIFTPDDTGLPQQLAAGTYEDIIRMEDDQCRFLSRNAVTDNAVVPRYLVFPL